MIKKLLYTALIALFISGLAFAGMNDRFSDIDLTQDDQIQLPERGETTDEASTSTDEGVPPENEAWIYAIDQDNTTRIAAEDNDGNVRYLNPTYRYIDLPLTSFTTLSNGEITIMGRANRQTDVEGKKTYTNFDDAYSYPYLESDPISPALVWQHHHPLNRIGADGETYGGAENLRYAVDGNYSQSPAMVTFRLPDDYRDNLEIEIWAHQDFWNSTASNVAIDYEHYRHQDRFTFDSVMDSSPTEEAPEYLDSTNGWASPDEVILSMNQTFAAGDLVSLLIWRVDDYSIIDDLRVLSVRARYTY